MSRKRTKNEVFTQQWTATQMIRQDHKYYKDIFLEPSAGNGNFLVAILKEKLSWLIKHSFTLDHFLKYGLLSVSNIYGIELFQDNVVVARKRMLKLFFAIIHQFLVKNHFSNNLVLTNHYVHNVKQIIDHNIVQGNSLTNLNSKKQALKLFLWKYNQSQHRCIKTANQLYLNGKSAHSTVKPDFVIGNPPYDIKNHTKNNISYSQVFNYFVDSAIQLKPRLVSLIIPNRWFSGGKNLSKFRKAMLNNEHLESMHIWNNSKDLFPSVAINGGVSYFLWNQKYNNTKQGIIVNLYNKHHLISSQKRPLKLPNTNVFIEDNIGAKIVQKISNTINKNNLGKHCSTSCPFTLRPYYPKRSANWLPSTKNNYQLFKHHQPQNNPLLKCYAGRHSVGFVKEGVVLSRLAQKPSKLKYRALINHYKLITPCANGIGINRHDWLNLILAEPNSICTETYIILGWDLHLNKTELHHLAKYVRTKFVRFLINLHKSSQHAVRKVYNLVPLVDFSNHSNLNWSASEKNLDKQLFKKFSLSASEINHIEQTIHFQY